jgi:molybdopterin-guanine dinucleotide biosynthesis protein A
MSSIAGIILAGGKSTRMGEDKGFISFNGKRLIEYSIDLLRDYCNTMIISSNNKAYRCFGYQVVSDEISGVGPVSGVASALKNTPCEWNFILGCDMPFLDGRLLYRILQASENTRGVIPVHNGLMEPLAALYHSSLYTFFSTAIAEGNFSLKTILQKSPDLLEDNPKLFSNLNSPDDFASLS